MTYRGSIKHKNRPVGGLKGTLCPEWTHAAGGSGFAADVDGHPWPETRAAGLFESAVVDQATGRRFNTHHGLAFEAKETNDGTWHGFPIPWESVPARIKADWLDAGRVSRRQVKEFMSFDRGDVHWALKTDSR